MSIATIITAEGDNAYTLEITGYEEYFNAQGATMDELAADTLVEVVDMNNLNPSQTKDYGKLRVLPNEGEYVYEPKRYWRTVFDFFAYNLKASLIRGYLFSSMRNPKWQQACPLYRVGVVTEIIDSKYMKVDVTMPYIEESPINMKCRTDYMSCDTAAFAVDDNVIVKFEHSDRESPVVVGFWDDPQPCEGTWVVITISGNGYSISTVWDPDRDRLAVFSGLSFPCATAGLSVTSIEGQLDVFDIDTHMTEMQDFDFFAASSPDLPQMCTGESCEEDTYQATSEYCEFMANQDWQGVTGVTLKYGAYDQTTRTVVITDCGSGPPYLDIKGSTDFVRNAGRFRDAYSQYMGSWGLKPASGVSHGTYSKLLTTYLEAAYGHKYDSEHWSYSEPECTQYWNSSWYQLWQFLDPDEDISVLRMDYIHEHWCPLGKMGESTRYDLGEEYIPSPFPMTLIKNNHELNWNTKCTEDVVVQVYHYQFQVETWDGEEYQDEERSELLCASASFRDEADGLTVDPTSLGRTTGFETVIQDAIDAWYAAQSLGPYALENLTIEVDIASMVASSTSS